MACWIWIQTWILLVSTSSELMAAGHLLILRGNISLMCLSCAALSFLANHCVYDPQCCHFFVLQKSLNSTILNPSLLLNLCLVETLLIQYNYIVSCCNLTFVAEFGCYLPSYYLLHYYLLVKLLTHSTQLFLFQLMTDHDIDDH